MKTYKWTHFQFLIVLVLATTINCEWFSSLGQMEDLVYAEQDLISSLKQYIQAEEDKLERVKKVADDFQRISDNARSNIESYLGHPVNQYRLVRRLVSEWSGVEELIMEDVTDAFLANLSSKREHFPDEEDVKGSAEAIMRLQDTYKLDTHDIAQGVVKGFWANQSLTAEDCFHIGRTAYVEKDYYHCTLWMNEVLRKSDLGSTSRFDILDHLAYCVAQQGNIEKAYDLTAEMLEIDPSHERINGNNQYYRDLLGEHKKGDHGEEDETSFTETLERPAHYSVPERDNYERLCRRDNITIPRKVEKRLKCLYWTNGNHPRLILQPAKVEELWHSPHIVRFHDIISDKEIAEIKAIAKPRLNRATVQNPATGKLEYANYRVSKSAWLSDWESPVVEAVCRRISDLTSLSMDTAEQLQIANYGVGGQYEPHFDFARKSDAGKFEDEIGNRIATFLAYLSDVEHGGNTVFLDPGVAVQPIKGSAVFWYNLLPSGLGDVRTRHAGCPVLTGVKWIANKWIHERDQEFRRPCGLKEYSDSRIF